MNGQYFLVVYVATQANQSYLCSSGHQYSLQVDGPRCLFQASVSQTHLSEKSRRFWALQPFLLPRCLWDKWHWDKTSFHPCLGNCGQVVALDWTVARPSKVKMDYRSRTSRMLERENSKSLTGNFHYCTENIEPISPGKHWQSRQIFTVTKGLLQLWKNVPPSDQRLTKPAHSENPVRHIRRWWWTDSFLMNGSI